LPFKKKTGRSAANPQAAENKVHQAAEKRLCHLQRKGNIRHIGTPDTSLGENKKFAMLFAYAGGRGVFPLIFELDLRRSRRKPSSRENARFVGHKKKGGGSSKVSSGEVFGFREGENCSRKIGRRPAPSFRGPILKKGGGGTGYRHFIEGEKSNGEDFGRTAEAGIPFRMSAGSFGGGGKRQGRITTGRGNRPSLIEGMRNLKRGRCGEV